MSIVAIAVGLSGIILSFFAGEEFPEYLRARYEFTWCRLCGYTEEQLRHQASKQAADRSRERLMVLSGYAFIALAVYATIYALAIYDPSRKATYKIPIQICFLLLAILAGISSSDEYKVYRKKWSRGNTLHHWNWLRKVIICLQALLAIALIVSLIFIGISISHH